MPYVCTSRPLPLVTLVKVPLWLLWYRAGSEVRPFESQSGLLISRMSSQPSPSASKRATPEPSDSGRYFFPDLPLLWVNFTPEAPVMSVKVTPFRAGAEILAVTGGLEGAAAPRANTGIRATETASRRFAAVFKLNLLQSRTA